MYIIIVTFMLFGLPMFLRGGGFHNHLVYETARIFGLAGFRVRLERPVHLPDGRLNFLDLLAERGDCSIAVEVETSARRILINAAKAEQAGLPLWVVVPTRKVKKAVAKKLNQSGLRPGGLRIYILLLSQLNKEVTRCFPYFPPANTNRENKENGKIYRKGIKR